MAYNSLQHAQADFRNLLKFVSSKDWRLGQEIEQIGHPILQGDFILHTPNGMLGDSYGDVVAPPPLDPVFAPTIPPMGPIVNPYSTDTPSFLDLINQIGAAISGGAHAYAMSATDIYKAQMQVAAMQAQARAGFVAQPTMIGQGGLGNIPPWMLLAGLGLIAVVVMKG